MSATTGLLRKARTSRKASAGRFISVFNILVFCSRHTQFASLRIRVESRAGRRPHPVGARGGSTGDHKVVTTDAVVLEIGAALARVSHRIAAVRFIDGLRADPNVEIVALDRTLFESAYRLFKERPDKDWSLTDCVSFVLTRERGISEALTADQHFVQAEIEALLLPV